MVFMKNENSIYKTYRNISEVYISFKGQAYMYLCAYLFSVCNRGITKIWRGERFLSCREKDTPLSSFS